MRPRLALALLTLTACSSGTYVEVNVEDLTGSIGEIKYLDVQLTNAAGQVGNLNDVQARSSGTFSIPPNFAFTITFDGSQAGSLHVQVTAYGAANNILATGQRDGQITKGQVTHINVDLGSGAESDGGHVDAAADMAGSRCH